MNMTGKYIPTAMDLRLDLEPCRLRHVDVEDYAIGPAAYQRFDEFPARAEGPHLESGGFGQVADSLARRLSAIDKSGEKAWGLHKPQP